MQTKHTPGPWVVHNNLGDGNGLTVRGPDGAIAALAPSVESIKDAVLIAAAPEMLKALERIELMLEGQENSEYQYMLSLIKPVLQKLNGE